MKRVTNPCPHRSASVGAVPRRCRSSQGRRASRPGPCLERPFAVGDDAVVRVGCPLSSTICAANGRRALLSNAPWSMMPVEWHHQRRFSPSSATDTSHNVDDVADQAHPTICSQLSDQQTGQVVSIRKWSLGLLRSKRHMVDHACCSASSTSSNAGFGVHSEHLYCVATSAKKACASSVEVTARTFMRPVTRSTTCSMNRWEGSRTTTAVARMRPLCAFMNDATR